MRGWIEVHGWSTREDTEAKPMYVNVRHISGVFPVVAKRYQASILFVNCDINVQESVEVVRQRIEDALLAEDE